MARNPHSPNVDDAEHIVVRPRSSHRKQRSLRPIRERLEPSQDRSRRRNEEILDAAARLLEFVNIEDLSHSDVAAAAGTSKASVHYHYPTIAALQLQLGRKFDAENTAYVSRHPRLRAPSGTWQDFVRIRAAVSRDWFNSHRAACEALLGPLLARENRLAGMSYNSQVGADLLQGLRLNFHLPDRPDLQGAISLNGEIIDLFWSRSYLVQGRIDDESLEESLRASVGYLRNFFPEYLPRRDHAG